jgi:hypothetical protein
MKNDLKKFTTAFNAAYKKQKEIPKNWEQMSSKEKRDSIFAGVIVFAIVSIPISLWGNYYISGQADKDRTGEVMLEMEACRAVGLVRSVDGKCRTLN